MENFINFRGKKVHYNDEGRGPAVVLLHGFLGSLQIWDEFSGELSGRFRVIRCDLPGHGKTEAMGLDHSMSLMAEMVKAVLDHLEVKHCIMIGHSMGGYVTLEFAKQYESMLRGIGLFHSHASPDTEEARENRDRTINIVRLNRSGFIKQFIPDLFAEENIHRYSSKIAELQFLADKTPAEGIIAALEGMKMRTGNIEFLMKTKLPVLFIAGKEDPRIPLQNIMSQAVLPDHAETLILGDVGHMGFIEAREKTLGKVRSFLERILLTDTKKPLS